jgi:protein gp37
MQESPIEWTDFTANPIRGLCPMQCPYCYARRHYQRFHFKKDGTINPTWDYTIRPAITNFVDDLAKIKKPSRIFVGSTMELFGDWVQDSWMKTILKACELRPQHTFIFLTKQPQNLVKFSPFPKNCWVGVSTIGNDRNSGLEDIFSSIKASVKFVSIEPLLDYTPMDFRWVDWTIVGAETKNGKPVKEHLPHVEWIKGIVEACDKVGVKVFLKNNLSPLFSNINNQVPNILYSWWGKGNCFGVNLRQEMPEVKVGVN